VIRTLIFLMFAALAAVPNRSFAQAMPVGYLCCNMRSDGSIMIDINYEGRKKHIVPAGTPLKVTGYLWHYRVIVDMNGKREYIVNDYSHDLSMEEFVKRYVVADDPTIRMANFPEKTRDAIASARLMKGMTREQVLMSVGYPVSSENPHLDDKTWKFWLGSFDEFDVKFDDDNRVIEVEGTADIKAKVLME
jgi:hypothetical protein